MTRDPLDDLGLHDAGLIELFSHLTSEPSADELSGEYAALTMFRTARRASAATAVASTVASAPHAAPRRAARARRTSRARVGGRLVAAAAAVAMVGSFAAAGYAEVLPSSLQHLAHQLLGFAGVPNSPGNSNSGKPTVPVASHRTAPGGPGSQRSSEATSHSSRSNSPSPHRSSTASPSPTVPAPAITLTETPRPHGRSELVVVSIPQAQRGDVVRLEKLVGGRWRLVVKHQLHPNKQTKFTLAARKISVTYRVVLSATVKHGQSVSHQVTVAAARSHHEGGQGQN